MYVKRLSTKFNPLDINGVREEEEKEAEEMLKQKKKVMTKLTDENNTTLPRTVHLWDPAAVADNKLSTPPKRRRGRPPSNWHRTELVVWLAALPDLDVAGDQVGIW